LTIDKTAIFQKSASDRTLIGSSETTRRAGHLAETLLAIHDDRDYARHIDYIHVNPLKHDYVKQVVDWPYSTFHRKLDVDIAS
jgi:REP element-mobilizing transposase RayT